MNTSDWLQAKQEREAPVADVLPSGLEIKRKRQVSVESLALSGQLPLTLLTELSENYGGQVELDMADVMGNVQKYMALIDAVFSAALVSPRVGKVTDLDNDTLALSVFDNEIADKLHIMAVVMEATEALRPFRATNGTHGAAAPRRQRVRKPAKRLAGADG